MTCALMLFIDVLEVMVRMIQLQINLLKNASAMVVNTIFTGDFNMTKTEWNNWSSNGKICYGVQFCKHLP
jgi:hypothetical protein